MEKYVLATDIVRLINEDLKEKYPDIDRVGNDIETKYFPKAFNVEVRTRAEKVADGIINYENNVTVRYFPENTKNSEEELYLMRDSLISYYTEKEYFCTSEGAGAILIEDLEASIIDKVLLVDFVLNIYNETPIKLPGNNETLIEDLDYE